MPLKCRSGDEPIFAFNVSDDEAWAKLKEINSKTKNLRMYCCDATVVLRTSSLGTRHFVHARSDACKAAPETEEHLLAKALIVDVIRQTDWIPRPEEYGVTPLGEKWRADVLALKGKSKIAFEIQWSQQSQDETLLRQERYTQSKVRGLWLFKQKNFLSNKVVPSFRIVKPLDSDGFEVLLPSPEHTNLFLNRSDEAKRWSQSIKLAMFVKGALDGRLRYAPVINSQIPVEVYATYVFCHLCKMKTGVIGNLVFVVGRVFTGCPSIKTPVYPHRAQPVQAQKILTSILPLNLLAQNSIGPLRSNYSKFGSYMANECIHCRALQQHPYDVKESQWVKIHETNMHFKSELILLLKLRESSINYWWFDEQ